MKLRNKENLVQSFISKFFLYFHTLRYLKPGQVFWRFWYKLYTSQVNLSQHPDLRQINTEWIIPTLKYQSIFAETTFMFLNKSKSLQEVGWQGTECDKLWRYNQHYFDDLNAKNSSERIHLHRILINDWIKKNPPGKDVGWEPYPTSLRIVNLVKWSLSGNLLSDEWLHSLAVQARWLYKNIEWHILGNHLFANAKALIFVGLFFDNFEAENWLKKGLKIVTDEINEQVLTDGGHFELSPMYHCIFLEDVLDLLNLFNTFPDQVTEVDLKFLKLTASRMLNWLNYMCHPDGEIAFFNDSAMGVSLPPREIELYAKRLKINKIENSSVKKKLSIKHNFDSGYIQLATDNVRFFLDVAPIGPDYLPGHGHADTLSFEMSFLDKRVFVNGGISQYGNGVIRQIERGTAAHNTVEIDNKNSSETWAGFRVAKRATPFSLLKQRTDSFISVSCKHDGYKRLSGRPIHQRTWKLSDNKILINDRIDGAFKSAKAYFLIHPDIIVTSNSKSIWKLYLPKINKYIHFIVLKGFANLESSFFSPEFGVRLPSNRLEVNFNNLDEIEVKIVWNIND